MHARLHCGIDLVQERRERHCEDFNTVNEGVCKNQVFGMFSSYISANFRTSTLWLDFILMIWKDHDLAEGFTVEPQAWRRVEGGAVVGALTSPPEPADLTSPSTASHRVPPARPHLPSPLYTYWKSIAVHAQYVFFFCILHFLFNAHLIV